MLSRELNEQTPAEVFFGRRPTTPTDVFRPRTALSATLTDTQVVMKRQFDRRHEARQRHFKQGENVMVELRNGERVNGVIRNIIGSASATVDIGDTITRHFNQLWKRHPSRKPSLPFQEVNGLPETNQVQNDKTQLDNLRLECVQSNYIGNVVVNDSEVEDLGNSCSEEVFQEVHTSTLHPDDGLKDCDSGSTAPDSWPQRTTRKDVEYRELSVVRTYRRNIE